MEERNGSRKVKLTRTVVWQW